MSSNEEVAVDHHDGLELAERVAGTDLTDVDASTLVGMVNSAPREQLDAAFADETLRERLLAEIFRRMSSHVRADKVRDLHAVVRWRLTGGRGEGGYDRYECTLADGKCTVSRQMSDRPRVTITVSPADFVRLISRQTTPAELYVTGKIKVKGDLGFAAGLIGYFDLPK
ncbi:SCP2 sterol-binding domain-containing protein [Thermocrispum municipale]|jgi:putative sterol carrier protein|uniref:SCP2 sterol-binding domain-containing protein n=1 Tax=Thermocrispum municipale TaxID=37926 RepID=UPI000A06F0C3|nr:SCP2 sterol-binding domain-containing protein [Thermocrispum municipale]